MPSTRSKLPHKRLNLDRFKKTSQGLIEFAILVEQAEPKNAENILAMAREVDPDFVFQALRKVVYFEEIVHVDEGVLAEILGKASPKILAFALHDRDEAFRHHVLRHLSLSDRKAVLEEQERMGTRVTKQFILGAQKHLLKMGRELESRGVITFEASDAPRLNPKKKRA